MDTFTPYTFLQCPCSETSQTCRSIREDLGQDKGSEDFEKTFDPKAARSNYSLYPLAHLLYCEDCRQIRCPRCVLEEIVTWYCPNCLFEVPSSTVRSEGNSRCTRSCFQCPICVAPLSVSSLEPSPEGLGADQAAQNGPFILNCTYCMWTSKEIGIEFDKQNGIFAQLSKVMNGGKTVASQEKPKNREKRWKIYPDTINKSVEEVQNFQDKEASAKNGVLDIESQFANLHTFYQSQLADAAPVGTLGLASDFGYGSPGTLSRIMGLYTGSNFMERKSKIKSSVMREASTASEGLQATELDAMYEEDIINQLRTEGWENSTTCSQRRDPINKRNRFLSELRPTAYLLRTKRSKRCRACRHILSKPDAKLQSTRFRIRLIALNYIPSINIRTLQPSSNPPLEPMKPVQFLLTFQNPLFEKIKITLATPAQTPGRFSSKITLLCPEFEVGANTDMWDEALKNGSSNTRDILVEKKIVSMEPGESQLQGEAGKVLEKGEIGLRSSWKYYLYTRRLEGMPDVGEDEDICEIPVFVRIEWETDTTNEESSTMASMSKVGESIKKRELAYWCVLGVGRIAWR
ncbi:dynactin Arp1 p62 subunit RO2 [Blumeria hordei DH14]|uniref:Dynactin subunit 4 n=1 Tax=Blumeria graminis f. sp. hordei (strain DH14) TaxID=546991 RepID=N1JDW9_BLUG1|nr:dynactin Arp1 p62 subunit RO2 [Blumeria hordei DH14]